MNDCIFCKVGRGEVPHNKVYEDADFVAFLDINPVSDGHTLVIPKKHVVWMQEADDETISGIFKVAKKLMLALKKGLNADYVMVSVVGKDVPHFHIHLIPRRLDDGMPQFPTQKHDPENAKEIVRKITQAL
jgi:histidine triad (HIT) family protein